MEKEQLEAPEKFDFPFEPYDIQDEFMRQLYDTLETGKLGIFESPTGTGKSLSIICGAIRWLKDHKEQAKTTLADRIRELESKKEEISKTTDDWITTQSAEIQITRELNDLKLQHSQILIYEKKIDEIKSKKKVSNKVSKTTKPFDTKETPLVNEEDDDEDMLLEEAKSSEAGSDSSDDDEDHPKYSPTKIYICSRTHSQLSQFVREILKSPFATDIRVATLASRQTYCINPGVTKLKNMSLINDKCLDMQKNNSKNKTKDASGKIVKKQKTGDCKCPFYKQTAIEELKDSVLVKVQDVEDLLKNSRAVKGCPYYASRLAAQDAEIILVPYNTILHKPTRDANGIILKNNVVIVDEAHNLLEAMAQMHNCEVTYTQLKLSLMQLKFYKSKYHTRFSAPNLLCINQLIFVLSKLQELLDKSDHLTVHVFTTENFVNEALIDNYNMFKLTKFCKDSRLAQKIRVYSSKNPITCDTDENLPAPKSGFKNFLSSIGKKQEPQIETEESLKTEQKSLGPTNPLLSVISFLETLTYSYSDGRIFIHPNQDKSKIKLQFLLLNPCQNFKSIVNEARSVIVAGGTMKPTTEFRDRLFLNAGASSERIVEFSCDHIIPKDNILPIIVSEGPQKEQILFSFDRRMAMGGIVKSVISECCRTVKGGIVAFFSSYSYENFAWQQIKDLTLGRRVFREPQDSGSTETVLKQYADAIKRSSSPGALLLSVVGGKLSEGLNFSDDLGRCIIVFGMPYANITSPALKEKMAYLDMSEGAGAGRVMYENICMKAVNQSIGRAVRHRKDFAAILLVDERYKKNGTKKSLPDWIQRSLQSCGFDETFKNIERFFKDKSC